MIFISLILILLIQKGDGGVTGGACHGGLTFYENQNGRDNDVEEINLSAKLTCFHQGYLAQMEEEGMALNEKCQLHFSGCENAQMFLIWILFIIIERSFLKLIN